MMHNVLLAGLLLSLGVALAEAERWREQRPSVGGTQRVVLALLVCAAVVVLLAAGVARVVQATTIGVWSAVLPAPSTPVLVDEVDA